MRKSILSGVAILALAGAASASEISGRITYLDPAGDLFVLNSSSSFTIGGGIQASDLAVGDNVRVTYDGAGDQMIASAVDVLTPSAPVAGAGGANAAGGAASGLGAAAGAIGGAMQPNPPDPTAAP